MREYDIKMIDLTKKLSISDIKKLLDYMLSIKKDSMVHEKLSK